MNLLKTTCILLFSGMLQNLFADGSPSSPNCSTNPPDFIRMSYSDANVETKSEEQSILGSRVKGICPEYITNLVWQLQSGNLNVSNKILAIYLLGIMRPGDSNSIETLIGCIDFRAVVFDPKSAIMRWGEYPAHEALIRIRGPVLMPVVAHLHSETNALRRRLMCNVVRCAEGWEGGMKRLRKLAAEESDAEQRKNLELSVKDLEKLPH